MQPSLCPLTGKPFSVRVCRRSCRYYGGVYNLVEMMCYAYGGTMEVTRYNKERRPRSVKNHDENPKNYY